MIDDGQAVDIKGISERSLMKHLKKLFLSLNLKEKGDRVFLLPSKALPTLDVVGPLIHSCMDPVKEQADPSAAVPETCSVPKDMGSEQIVDDHMTRTLEDNSVGPSRRWSLFLPFCWHLYFVSFTNHCLFCSAGWLALQCHQLNYLLLLPN